MIYIWINKIITNVIKLPKLILKLHEARQSGVGVIEAQQNIDKFIKWMLDLFGEDF